MFNSLDVLKRTAHVILPLYSKWYRMAFHIIQRSGMKIMTSFCLKQYLKLQRTHPFVCALCGRGLCIHHNVPYEKHLVKSNESFID